MKEKKRMTGKVTGTVQPWIVEKKGAAMKRRLQIIFLRRIVVDIDGCKRKRSR